MEAAPLRAYLVDDEPLAIERLTRLLASFDNLEIVATATDPAGNTSSLSAGLAVTGTDSTWLARCWAKLTLTAAWSSPAPLVWPDRVIVTGIV